MKLNEFCKWLNENPLLQIAMKLPDGTSIPAHFHVTEVGRVHKDFIDCGGTTRSTTACVLQLWVADDVEHRLNAFKLSSIMSLASPLLKDEDLPIEVEYEAGLISQFPLVSGEVTPSGLVFSLGSKHTACLALDRCGLSIIESDGCSVPGCC